MLWIISQAIKNCYVEISQNKKNLSWKHVYYDIILFGVIYHTTRGFITLYIQP